MEIANPFSVRPSRRGDAHALTRLLETTPYAHWHVDWRLPVDWLGTPGFVVAEEHEGELVGCLAVIPDPPPAAWVRVAAIRSAHNAHFLLSQMWREAVRALYQDEVYVVAWLQPERWPTDWLTVLRFRPTAEIETFVKEDLFLPSIRPNPALVLRPARDADMPALEAIEVAAFDPIWRHSEEGLRHGRKEAISFQVAELEGNLVGFQYSVPGQGGGAAHLVRLTVDPAAQGKQVGSALLVDAITGYWNRRLTRITLNTQVDNLPSQRLYARFGFYPAGARVPVWTCTI